MHPAQVLDLQADFYERCMQHDVQDLLRSHFVMDLLAYIDRPSAVEQSNTIIRAIPHALQVASAYYVEPDMTDLVVGASAGLDETDRFRHDELPTECGFAYFERPMILHDIRGADLNINGVLWFTGSMYDTSTDTTRRGVVFVLLNDQWSTPDVIAEKIMAGQDRYLDYDLYRAHMGRWGVIGFEIIGDGLQIGSAMAEPDRVKYEQLIEEGLIPSEFTNTRRLVHSFWLMLGQTVARVSDSEIPRPYARRAKRARIPQRVTVVRLRRSEKHGDGIGETAVEWSHRWWSRGHWRWQPVSEHHPLAEPDGEGGYKARLYIRGSVKGPEGLPLKISTKVYDLAQ